MQALIRFTPLKDIGWMAVIAAVFFGEKNVRFGDLLPKAVGVACVAGGLAVDLV